VEDHTRNLRAVQHEDQVDFPCSQTFLTHYYRQGLSPFPMGLRQRRSTPGRSGKPIGRPLTSEPVTEELARLRQENTDFRAKNHALGKEKQRLEIEVHVLQQKLDATKKKPRFRGIADTYA